MSLLHEPNSADTVGEESQNHEHDLQSLACRNNEIDEDKLKRVIKEIKKSTDNLPDQIIEAAKAVLDTSSGFKWLQNNKEDFERIIRRASILLVVLWQSYKESSYHSLDSLIDIVDYLTETVHRIHRLMERKFKNIVKRILEGYVVRDIGKLKKYEERLDSVEQDMEKKLRNMKINDVLLEVFDSRAQHSARGDLLEDTQRKATIQEPLAEGSNSQLKANAAVKSTNRRMKSEEEVDQTKSKASDKDAHKCKNKGKTKEIKVDEDVEEGTSGPSQTSEDEESTSSEDVPSLTTMVLLGTKKPAMTPKQNKRRQTAPPQLSTSGPQYPQSSQLTSVPPSSTSVPPSSTSVPPSSTSVPRSSTSVPRSSTSVPRSSTSVPRSSTSVHRSSTFVPRSPTLIPPSSTSVPRSSTTVPQSFTSAPQASVTGFSFNNHGPGIMNNTDIGNIRNFQPRRPTYAG